MFVEGSGLRRKVLQANVSCKVWLFRNFSNYAVRELTTLSKKSVKLHFIHAAEQLNVGPPISIVILLESVKDLKVKLFIHSNQRDN